MEFLPITENDIELVQAARQTMKRFFKPGKHHVAAALRTAGGTVYTGIHLEAHVGGVAVCAEAAVLSKAVSEEEKDFDAIVAVRHPRDHEQDRGIKVVSPCGMCRELLTDYAEDLKVILNENGELRKTYVRELLPHKYDH